MQASTSLWSHGAFIKLWAGQTAAQMAAQISFLAVPLVATIVLDATPLQMGLLTAVASLPALVLGLHAGAIVDRRPRRPIMIGADLVRATALASIPVAWWLDMLSIPLLYLIVLVSGVGSLLFDVAYGAFLPSVVERQRLVEGNSKLELSRTASELAGPGLAGNLIQVLGAPLTLLGNAFLYLVSVLTIWRIRVREHVDDLGQEQEAGMWGRIQAGLGIVWRTGTLRAVVGTRGVLNLFNAMLEAVFVLYIVQVLDVGPATLGIVFSIGGLGFLVGALLPSLVNRRLGLGATTAMALVVVGASDLLVPLAEGSGWLVVPLLIAAQFFFGIGMTLFNVNQVSIRQVAVPDHLRGRAGATARFVAMGVVPIGALLGGVLGEAIGLRQTLVLAAIGEITAALWLWFSPVRAIRQLPEESVLSEAP
ncbi:MAG: MFS transporter [Chloroflexia bacterium]|nr:MFS transporter [Chloroflexia bacterium]